MVVVVVVVVCHLDLTWNFPFKKSLKKVKHLKIVSIRLHAELRTWITHYQELSQKHENLNGHNLTHIKDGDPIGPPFCSEFRCGSF